MTIGTLSLILGLLFYAAFVLHIISETKDRRARHRAMEDRLDEMIARRKGQP